MILFCQRKTILCRLHVVFVLFIASQPSWQVSPSFLLPPQSSLPFLCPFLPLSTSRKPVLRAECVTCLRSHSIFRRLRRVPGTAPLSSPSPSSTGQEVRGVHQAVSWGGKARGSGCSWTAIEVAPGGGGRLGVPSTRSHTALHTAASLAPAGSVGVDTPPLVCP